MSISYRSTNSKRTERSYTENNTESFTTQDKINMVILTVFLVRFSYTIFSYIAM